MTGSAMPSQISGSRTSRDQLSKLGSATGMPAWLCARYALMMVEGVDQQLRAVLHDVPARVRDLEDAVAQVLGVGVRGGSRDCAAPVPRPASCCCPTHQHRLVRDRVRDALAEFAIFPYRARQERFEYGNRTLMASGTLSNQMERSPAIRHA